MHDTPLLHAEGLTKRYGKRLALDHLDLTLERGKIIGLLGPNGSGKTTTIKLLNGLLTPTAGTIAIDGHAPGKHTHSVVSYLPERTYLNKWMRARDIVDFFADFYADFDKVKALDMMQALYIEPTDQLKNMSKGTQEKVQLILVMSRAAQLYVLDEPIGGVDPAARDLILRTILTNYSENSSVLLSTHLISDIESVLDDVIFLKQGKLVLHDTVDNLRTTHEKSIDALFREVFAC